MSHSERNNNMIRSLLLVEATVGRRWTQLAARGVSSVAILIALAMGLSLGGAPGALAEAPSARLDTPPQPPSLPADGLAIDVTNHTYHAGFSLGSAFGNAVCGSTVSHDLALGSIKAGWILGEKVAQNHWYRGNVEVVGELFTGVQFRPDAHYIVGLTPLLRYDFTASARWVFFLTAGAGVTATDIGHPDLSGTLQFSPQAGMGTCYFLRKDLSLDLEWRWLHISNAGMELPNHGVNTQLFQVGLTWWF